MKAACCAISLCSAIAFAVNAQSQDSGRQEEQRACTPCHSLRLVDSQRLSRAAWQKELTKMIGWGAVVTDKELLLDYLSREYNDSKPVPKPELSGDASAQRAKH
jgi:hypothetical protein